MSVSVNGVDVTIEGDMTAETAAARELLRQRALALGLLEDAVTDEETVEGALEELLLREVAIPDATEDECRRYYESQP